MAPLRQTTVDDDRSVRFSEGACVAGREDRQSSRNLRHRLFKALSVVLLLVALAILGSLSLRLAGIRIYQVDECQNVMVARILATGQAGKEFSPVSLFSFPLIWITRGAAQSVDMFVRARFLALEVFWLNIFLVAAATGTRLLSLRGLAALLGAATLSPLWDYGFEIRHDSVVLCGVLLLWCAVRVRPAGIQSYLLAGGLVMALEFVALKAFVYTLPISLAVLAFPPPGHRQPRWKLLLAWTVGLLLVFLAVRIAYGQAGYWQSYVGSLRELSKDVSSAGNRFGPGQTLFRLLGQTPLLLAVALAALFASGTDLLRRGRRAITWDSNLPEAMLLLVALVALLINPAPYPYNLLHVVPYAFLLAFRYAVCQVEVFSARPALWPLAATVLLFTHVVPFAVATSRHWNWTNYHQEGVMQLAEALTDPIKDPVYDGVGLVPARPRIGYHWFLHSLNVRNFTSGSGPRVRDLLATNPAAVLLPNYRTDWLTDEDHEFIRSRYVPMADDFWVLGATLPAGGGAFEIIHPGRYRISSLKASDIMGTYPAGWAGLRSPEDTNRLSATLDGASLSGEVVQLSPGTHRLETPRDTESAVVWVGPRLDRIHRVSQNDHLRLFVNWY